MPLLDTLEFWFTRRRPDPRLLSPSAEKLVSFGRWLVPASPDRDLKATDFYDFSLCLRCAWGMVARISLVYSAPYVVGLIWVVLWLWHTMPVLFHVGRRQVRFWHGLWLALWPGFVAKGLVLIPLVPLGWALFSLIFWLLRTLFWNRRARRLRAAGEGVHMEEAAEIVILDVFVWPPPPRR